jgi:hypothetical protein
MIQTPLTRYIAKERSKAQWAVHRAAFELACKRGANFHEATLAGFNATDEIDTAERVDIFPNLS